MGNSDGITLGKIDKTIMEMQTLSWGERNRELDAENQIDCGLGKGEKERGRERCKWLSKANWVWKDRSWVKQCAEHGKKSRHINVRATGLKTKSFLIGKAPKLLKRERINVEWRSCGIR